MFSFQSTSVQSISNKDSLYLAPSYKQTPSDTAIRSTNLQPSTSNSFKNCQKCQTSPIAFTTPSLLPSLGIQESKSHWLWPCSEEFPSSRITIEQEEISMSSSSVIQESPRASFSRVFRRSSRDASIQQEKEPQLLV